MLPGRYNIDNALQALKDPALVRGEINRLGTQFNCWWHSVLTDHPGFDVMAEDWDNLLILDACRPDILNNYIHKTDSFETRTSPGTDSWEFLQKTFADQTYHDTVYVTANPHATKLDNTIFHAMRLLLTDGWDEHLQTVRPETVVTAAKKTIKTFPRKRLIVHFMQPHTPFIGELGQELAHEVDFRNVTTNESPAPALPTVWRRLQYGQGDCSLNEVRDAYRENVRIALSHATDLADSLPGKTVLTADHGEMLGERQRPLPVRGYEHTAHLYLPELTEVPWFILPFEERRRTIPEPPVNRTETPDNELVEERLKALGYQ